METLANVLRLVSFLFLICTLRVNGRDDDPRVTTSLGELVGSLVQVNDTESNSLIDVKQFLAVPFAKPPLGNLRFRKPEAVEAWTEPFQCKDMPNACVQYMAYPFPWAMSPHDPHISEDCLYLNIWVPSDASPQNKKQVFFFIHGGGFFTGSIRQPIYDGRALAGLGDVIVVTTNYRLGTLGFWSNNGIDAPGNVARLQSTTNDMVQITPSRKSTRIRSGDLDGQLLENDG
ncbi:Acetylcholinesterase [Araneus ventricosus]|uniref:Acetylcholinesterase n=1 Tax=Araneus ventricosus TaxID=182803 RepID=A0A4Y2G8Y2_ARAVE|nr:Acetylcholinesterase [Araneus ventricosus]